MLSKARGAEKEISLFAAVMTIEGAAPELDLIAGDIVVPVAGQVVTPTPPEDLTVTFAPFLVSAYGHQGQPLGYGEVKLGSGEEGEEGSEFHSNRV